MKDEHENGEIIVPKSGIVSLDEARNAAEQRTAVGMGDRGLKRTVSRKECGEIAFAIAADVSERTYNAIAKEQAEQLEKLEAMCSQFTENMVASLEHRLEQAAEQRTWRARGRRAWESVRGWFADHWNDEVPV